MESLFDISDEEDETRDIVEALPPIDLMDGWIERNRTRKPNWSERKPSPVDYEGWGRIQEKAVSTVFERRAAGIRSVVGCGVTGFGKTRVAELILKRLSEESQPAVFYTHRQMLLTQTHERFEQAGIKHGVRAAALSHLYDPSAPIQLAMIQSERAATKRKAREYHDAAFVIWDEHHANANGDAKKMWEWHRDRGAFQLGLTATPVNLGHCDELLYFGRPSEMRKIGAIVPATYLGPDEVDLKDVRKMKTGEYSSTDLRKRFMVQQVVGSVYDHFFEQNRELRPTLGFAPDVASAMWFVDEGWGRGIACCSIDGEKVYFGQKRDGRRLTYRGAEAREMARELSRRGVITITWNRMVFAMGVDWPWLEHLIFATALGTTQFWIQACGRGLRACGETGKSGCLIQDHGGNWRRHPSCNADIEWELGDTNKTLKEKKENARADGKEEVPKRCNKCGKIMNAAIWRKNGLRCVFCGVQFKESMIPVWQTNGRLKQIPESRLEHKKKPVAEAQKLWNNLYWSAKNSPGDGSNFNQLRGRFNTQNGDRYQVIEGKFGSTAGQIVIWDVVNKTTTPLANAPPVGSPEWNQKVKSVDRSKLQHARQR